MEQSSHESAGRDDDGFSKEPHSEVRFHTADALIVDDDSRRIALLQIEVCLAFYSYCVISESAREGTRWAIVRGSTCTTGSGGSCTASAASVNSFVSSIGWPNLGNGSLTPSASFPDGNENPGSRVQVVVNYTFPYSIPFAPKGSIHMSATSVMYIVQ